MGEWTALLLSGPVAKGATVLAREGRRATEAAVRRSKKYSPLPVVSFDRLTSRE